MLKGSFFPHCWQILSHRGSSDFWGFLCFLGIVAGPLPYYIKHQEATAVDCVLSLFFFNMYYSFVTIFKRFLLTLHLISLNNKDIQILIVTI